MAGFDAADAALEGFRLTREQPRAVAVWTLFALACSLVVMALLIVLGGEAISEFNALTRGRGEPDPEETLAALGRMGPALAVVLPLGLVYNAVLYSAIYRALLRPEDGGPGFLRFGGDELRLFGALILVALLYFGLIMAGSILLAILSAVAGAAGGAVAALVAVLGVFALLAAIVVFAVRFSLVLPATFAQRKIRVLESWRLTKGRFWPLLGAYLLAIVLAFVIMLLSTMIYFALAALLTGGVTSAASVFAPDYGSLGEFFTPAMGLYLLVSAVVSAVTTAVVVGSSAAAYRAFGEGEAARPA